MKTLRKVSDVVDKVFMFFSVILLTIIIIASFLQVFTRYVMSDAIVGMEEICRYSFIWMGMLGASLCVKRGKHPAVTILADSLNPKKKFYYTIIINAIIILVVIALGRYSIQIVKAAHKQSSVMWGIRMSYMYLSVPIGCAGMAFNAVVNIAESIYARHTSGTENLAIDSTQG